MSNPVESISQTRSRLARLAAQRVAIAGLPPVAIVAGLGASLSVAAAWIGHGWGYRLASDHAGSLREAAFMMAALGAIATAVAAWRAWRQENDFERAAEKIDTLIGAHQEVLTFATMANPARPAAEEARSPLFAMLAGRATAYLRSFDPRRAFPLAPGPSLRRAALATVAAILILGLTALIVLGLPNPLEVVADGLRNFADTAATLTNTPGAPQVAAAARAVANDLTNPRLPPEQKLAELEAIQREIDKVQQAPKAQAGSGNSQRQGQGNGKGSGNAAGNGNGEGGGGKGEGAGTGGKDQATGAGVGQGGQNNQNGQQQMSLKNELAKAQAKLETEANADKSSTAPSQDRQGHGAAPLPGANPHQSGSQASHNGADNVPLPEPGKLGLGTTPPSGSNAAAHKDDKGSQGDTHLGDFPKQVAYERFYKLGDKGPPLDLRDARYVTFRVPPAVAAGNGAGRIVHDSGTTAATTPYTNAPLKEQSLIASPDEEQLLPPRYRDLIR